MTIAMGAESPGRGPVFEGALHPPPHPDQGLDLVLGAAHDLLERGVLPQQLLEQPVRLDVDGDPVEDAGLGHGLLDRGRRVERWRPGR